MAEQRNEFVRVTGIVVSHSVNHVNKRAGTTNLRVCLRVQVEDTEPPEARERFGAEQDFIGDGRFADLNVEPGQRVAVVTYGGTARSVEPLAIYEIVAL
jgi:hypothetical protein